MCSTLISTYVSAQQLQAIEASADAYWQEGLHNINELRVENNRRTTYIQFDVLDSPSNIRKVTLRMKVGWDPGFGTLQIFHGGNATWSETSATLATLPNEGNVIGTFTGVASRGDIIDIDVTDGIEQGVNNFVLKMNAGSNDISFFSKEAGNGPALIIERIDPNIVPSPQDPTTPIADPSGDPLTPVDQRDPTTPNEPNPSTDPNNGKNSIPFIENFELSNGTTSDNGQTKWKSTDGEVLNNAFVFSDAEGSIEALPIELKGKTVRISVDVGSEGGVDYGDYLRVHCVIDGQDQIMLDHSDDLANNVVSAIVEGEELLIKIYGKTTHFTETYYINSIIVEEDTGQVSSQPVDPIDPVIPNIPVPNPNPVPPCGNRSIVSGTGRGRIKNVKENGSWRIVTDLNTNLRGIGGWWHGVNEDTNGREDPEMYYEDAWWKAMWENGLNVSRNIVHDPWRRARYGPGNGYEMGQEGDRNEFFKKMDQIVALSAKYNMYVVINYHEVGKVDMNMCREFWAAVAPRYKDYTHISYELMNEPNGARDWNDKDTRNVEEMYQFVRKLAPETHLLLCSFSNMGPDWVKDDNRSMLAAARSLKGIDWSNAGVAFHSYWGENAAHYVEELIAEFPALNTEINLPQGYNSGDPYDDHIRTKSLAPGENWNQETMERLSVGWMTWEHDTWREYYHNYLGSPSENKTSPGKPGLLYEAKRDGWVWKFDYDLVRECDPPNDFVEISETIEEDIEAAQFNIYPNPLSGRTIMVELPEQYSEGGTLSLVDMKGSVISQQSTIDPTANITLSNKPSPGLYIVRFLASSGESFSKKILVK